MNTKTYSILLSCLIVGNFFIELNAHIRRRNAKTEIQPNIKENLDLTLTNVENILIIQNTTSNAASALDLDQNILLLLDGSCGSGVIVILSDNRTALISSGLWEARKESIQDFLESLNNDISELLQNSDCHQYSLSSCPKNILDEISKIVQDLVILIDLELQQSPVLALELIVSISISIVNLANGDLSGLNLAIRNQVIKLSVDISGVLNVLQGIAKINSLLNVNTTELCNLYPDINIASILEASDGILALADCFKQLKVTGLDLSPLTQHLSDKENLFKIIVKLGGSISFGISGVFRVVVEILANIEGKSNLERLISLLIQYVAQSSQQIHKNLSQQLKEELSQLEEILLQLSCSHANDLIQIVRDLLDQKLIVDGVNISEIISILLAGACEPKEGLLSVIVEVLLSLVNVIAIVESLPTLLLVIIIQLDSILGIQNLIALGINLVQPLQDVLLSVLNLPQLLLNDLVGTCNQLPLISDVVLAIEAAITEKCNDSLSLKQLLSVSESVPNLIKGVFQLVFNVDLGIPKPKLDQCKDAITVCNGLRAYVDVDLIVIKVTLGI